MISTFILYNFILFGSTLCVYMSEKCKFNFDKRILLLIAFLIVTIPAAIRYNIGYDYPSYVEIFNRNANISHVEILWSLLIKWLNYIGLSSSAFFFISSLLTYAVLFASYPKKNGYAINFMYITWFYFDSFTFIRSALIVSIMMYTIFAYTKQQKNTKFIIICIISGFFIHKSAFLFIFIPILSSTKIYKYVTKKQTVIVSILLFSVLFNKIILDFFILLPIIDWLGYRYYIDEIYFSEGLEFNSGIGFLIKLIVLITPLFFIQKNGFVTNSNKTLILPILVCVFSLFFSIHIGIFLRIQIAFIMGYMFALYVVLASPNKITGSYDKLIASFIIVVLSIVVFENNIMVQTTDKCQSTRISPYISIFDKDADKSIPWEVCEFRKWNGIDDE